MRIAAEIAALLAVSPLLGKAVAAFLGATTAGGAIIGGLLLFGVIAALLYYVSTRFAVPEEIVKSILLASLILVAGKIALVSFPFVQQAFKEAFYNALPRRSAQAARERAEDTDARLAAILEPHGTAMRDFLFTYRKVMDRNATQTLRSDLGAKGKKLGLTDCWTSEAASKNPKATKVLCTPATLSWEIQQVLASAKTDLAAIDQMSVDTDADSSSGRGVYNTIKGWLKAFGDEVKSLFPDKDSVLRLMLSVLIVAVVAVGVVGAIYGKK